MANLNQPAKATRRWIAVLTLGIAIGLFFTNARPFAPAAADSGSIVIFVRHGDAPGSGEPKSFDLNDCSTQRNLSDQGREKAREIGDMLRAHHVSVGKVLASRLCRTRQTAKLMRISPVETNSAFDDLADNKENASELLSRERSIVDAWHGPGALVIVTHGSNIKALTGLRVDQGTVVDLGTYNGQLMARLFNPTDE